MRVWVAVLLAGCVVPQATLDQPAPPDLRFYDAAEAGIHHATVLLDLQNLSRPTADALRSWGWTGAIDGVAVCATCPDLDRQAQALASALEGPRCLNVIAAGPAGVMVRWMLAKVEEHDPAYPAILCIKAVATIATDHACATCNATERAWLASNATRPLGSGGTDWYVFGTTSAHLAMEADHAVRYLDATRLTSTSTAHVSHAIYTAGATVETRLAPAPLQWFHQALVTGHTDWAPAHINTAPAIADATPGPGSYALAADEPFTVTATCGTDLEGDALWIDFRLGDDVVTSVPVRAGEAASKVYRFQEAGSWPANARCRDAPGAVGTPVVWLLTTSAPPTGEGPNIESVDPPAGTYSVEETFEVRVECRGEGVRVRFIANDYPLSTVTDRAGMTPAFSFSGRNATVHAAAMCIDEHGRHGPSGRVDWTLHFL